LSANRKSSIFNLQSEIFNNSAVNDILSRFCAHRVIASIRATTADMAFRAAEAVVAGGILLLEVPYSTPGAARVISDLRRTFGTKVLVGAGDVTTIEAADRAVKANAQFVTLPFNQAMVVDFCRRQSVFAVPGVATPNEIAALTPSNPPLLRVFPAACFGGPVYLGHLRRAFPDQHLMAAGGIPAEQAADYLKAGTSVVTVGSGLFSPDIVSAADFAQLTERARRLAEKTAKPLA
jgi:2-dehydro-3-deoxyphosphogluconate aldolase/(4S)-4-hydroxy-2-oxoglutarate aldolase